MPKSRTYIPIAIAVLLGLFIGCDPKQSESSNSASSGTAPSGPTTTGAATTWSTPLRLWIVSQVSDPTMVERQWLSGSEQALEIRSLSVDEFLAESKCNCDVTIFPARLLGEMIDRKWISKLPPSLNANANSEDSVRMPAAWSRQVAFGSTVWALPLGGSFPLIVVSSSAAESAKGAQDWNALLKSLAMDLVGDSTGKPRSTIDVASVDRTALVDRFFAIAGSLTNRSPDYGLLFELQSMKPRLTEPEFVQAANILCSLATQASDDPAASLKSVIGDSSQSWLWINAQSKPAVTITTPSLLSRSAAMESGCKAVRIPEKWIGWNTGSGLIASMSANCRQSAQATVLLRWLGRSDTRQSLSAVVAGMESASPVAGSDSAAWQATSLANELASNGNVPSELRLARAEEYRQALAESLIEILRGTQPAIALAKASETWQTITEKRGRLLQRADYEKSLGLVRD